MEPRLRRRLALLVLPLLALGLLALASPTAAQPPPTPFPTPTPNERGEILYTVQPGDTAWRIAAIAGISLQELYALNGLEPTDFLVPGQQLLLGMAGPAEPTPLPGATPTPSGPTPTPTPAFGTGEICVLLFLDRNGDARLQEDEPPLPGGRISVVHVSGTVAGEHTTDENPEGFCFTDLKNGDYNVSAAVPEGYNATTVLNLPVRLEPGDIHYVEFGAQPSAALGGDAPVAEGSGRSTLLGVVGGLLLLAAAGLGYYASRYSRRSPMSLR